jgi:hypothetical protein
LACVLGEHRKKKLPCFLSNRTIKGEDPDKVTISYFSNQLTAQTTQRFHQHYHSHQNIFHHLSTFIMPSTNNGNSRSTDDKPSAPVFFGPERPPHGPASQAAADAARASKEKEEDPLCVALRERMKAGGIGPGGFSVGV